MTEGCRDRCIVLVPWMASTSRSSSKGTLAHPMGAPPSSTWLLSSGRCLSSGSSGTRRRTQTLSPRDRMGVGRLAPVAEYGRCSSSHMLCRGYAFLARYPTGGRRRSSKRHPMHPTRRGLAMTWMRDGRAKTARRTSATDAVASRLCPSTCESPRGRVGRRQP